MTSPVTDRAWLNAVLGIYLASGLAISAWLVRVPAIAADLHLSAGPLGMLLLAQTLGAFLSVSASGAVVMRLGAQKTLAATFALMMLGGLGLAAAVSLLHSVPLAAAGFALFGLGQATYSVAANVQGAAVERAVRRQRMSLMHGCFSIGTVIGSLVGTVMTALGVSVFAHLAGVYAVTIVLVAVSLRFTRHEGADVAPAHTTGLLAIVDTGGRFTTRHAWAERRTVLIGLFVLGLALVEGSANDWVALALTTGYGTDQAFGAVGYGLFVTAMTSGRLLGTGVLSRHGRVAVMRVGCLLAIAGLAAFILSPWLWLGMIAIFVWGIGAALGFPVGMSAAADDPVRASARVSVVSTIGYAAFLGGPPILGLLGDALGVRLGLSVVLLLAVMSLLLVPQLAAPEGRRRRVVPGPAPEPAPSPEPLGGEDAEAAKPRDSGTDGTGRG